ncbi:MAG: HDOD domain-containing protein [Planctomycetaceae bacterium]|nr:HDOD domain-containing protein [Planctomycetaceae bacterium]
MSHAQTPAAWPSGRTTTAIVSAAIQRTNNLATLPEITHRIVMLTGDPQASVGSLQAIIKHDPVLSARILRVVNSPFYGVPGEVGTIDRAIVMLGLNAVKNIAIAASLDKVIRAGHIAPGFDARDLWTHSVTVASAAFLLAETAQPAWAGEAFLAGLIHDLGIMIEMEAYPQEFTEVIERLASETDSTFRQLEDEILGATHEQFGAALCEKWRFPTRLQDVAAFHHRPWELPVERRPFTALVHIADVLAAQLGAGYTRTVEADDIDPMLVSAAYLNPGDVQAVAEALPTAARDAQKILL